MSLSDKMRHGDRAIIDAMFQPVQDSVSTLRQCTDHLLAVACYSGSLFLSVFRRAFLLTDHPLWHRFDVLTCVALLINSAVIAVIWGYGRLHKNRTSPGIFFDYWWGRALIVAVMIPLLLLILLTESGMLLLVHESDNILYIFGSYLAGCGLRKPPPPVRREVFAPAMRCA
jgi:Zn-dependent protease